MTCKRWSLITYVYKHSVNGGQSISILQGEGAEKGLFLCCSELLLV